MLTCTNMYDILQTIIYYSIGLVGILTFVTSIASLERVRYHIKFTYLTTAIAIVPTVCMPFMLLRIRDWRNALPVAYVIKQIIKFLGVKFHVRGKENIVKNSGSIVLINHQSVVDLCVLAELWPLLKRGTVIAKKEILYFGLFGITTWLWGTIFIDRKRSKEAQDILNDAGKTVKHLKANLFLFPEGHRHSGSTLLPFKKGAFHIAIATQLPIQPVVVSKYYFLNSKAKTFNSGNSYITILPPISTEGLTMDDLPKLKEEVYACMNKTYTTTSQEVVNEYVDSVIGK